MDSLRSPSNTDGAQPREILLRNAGQIELGGDLRKSMTQNIECSACFVRCPFAEPYVRAGKARPGATCPKNRAVTRQQSRLPSSLMSDVVFELEAEWSTRYQLGKRVTIRRRDA